MKRLLGITIFLVASSVQAALVDRGEGFIYDSVLDLTWTQNANINGSMGWNAAVAWADGYSQTHSVYGTFDDWRLPTTQQPDPSCSIQFGGDGLGVGCIGSEMGHLANVYGISFSSPGPFTNLLEGRYWSGTAYAPNSAILAWFFNFGNVNQDITSQGNGHAAFAVRSGDIAASVIPVPAAVWLFGSGLLALAGLRRLRR